jgi:hypothetical protein
MEDNMSRLRIDDLPAEVTFTRDEMKKIVGGSELSTFSLQQIYTDYQQAMSTLCNIMKQNHDDAMNIIGNLKS